MSAPSQLALTLRAVGGLTTTQIAAAFLVPEAAANQQPALALYAPTGAGLAHAPFAVKVLTVHGDRISAITGFVTPHLFPAFGLPATVLSARAPGSA